MSRQTTIPANRPSDATIVHQMEVINGSRLLLQLQLALVVFKELLEVFGSTQQPGPLFVVKRDRETAQAVDADSAFFADAELHRPGAFRALLFEFGNFGFQFFVRWLGHDGSPRRNMRRATS